MKVLIYRGSNFGKGWEEARLFFKNNIRTN